MMGDSLSVRHGDSAGFTVRVAQAKGARIEVLFDGERSALLAQRDLLQLVDGYCWRHDPRLVRHADRVLGMEDGAIRSDWRQTSPLKEKE